MIPISFIKNYLFILLPSFPQVKKKTTGLFNREEKKENYNFIFFKS